MYVFNLGLKKKKTKKLNLSLAMCKENSYLVKITPYKSYPFYTHVKYSVNTMNVQNIQTE